MTDIATAAPTMSKLKKPTPIKSGIPKLVTSSPSPSPVSSTPTKPSRLPVSRPLSRSISSSPSSTNHDTNNPPNTPVTPASAKTPIKRVTQSIGRPATPDASRLSSTSRIPSKLPPTPSSGKPQVKMSTKAAAVTSRLSTPSHSRAQSVSVDQLDTQTTRVTPSRVPVSKLVRPSTAGSSRIGKGRPASQSIASSTASSVAGTAHSSPKQTPIRSMNQDQRKQPDVIDLDAILASAEAAQQAAKEVNEQERDLSTQQLSPRLQTLHQRRKSEKSLVVDAQPNIEPHSPGLLDLDNFDTFDDTDFDSPAARPVQSAAVPAIQQPMFDDADMDAPQQSNYNQPAADLQSESLFEDEDIDFDDSNDNNLVEAPVKPMQECKEEDEQPSFFTQPIVSQTNTARAMIGSASHEFEEKEQEPDHKASKFEVEVVESQPEAPVAAAPEPPVEPEITEEPAIEEPAIEEPVNAEPVMAVVEAEPAEAPVAKTEKGLLDDDLSAFDNDDPLEFDDDFFEASPNVNKQSQDAELAVQSEAASFIVVEPVAVDSDSVPSTTPPTRTPNVTIVEQPQDLHVEQRSEPWSLMGQTDDINEICFEDEHQPLDEDINVHSAPLIQIEKVDDHLSPDCDDIVTRTPAPSTVEPSHSIFSGPRTPAPSTVEPPTQTESVVIESFEQAGSSTLAPFDSLSSQHFDSDIETRTPAPTAWSAPQPEVKEDVKPAVVEVEAEPAVEPEVEPLDDGLDLSFDDDLSLPVSPVHAAAGTQPEVQTLAAAVKDDVNAEAEASKAAAAKLRAAEEARRAEHDRQLASQAAIAAAALKERQEAERAEAERIEEERRAAEKAEFERRQAEQQENERMERERREQEEQAAAQAKAEENALSEKSEVSIDPVLLDKWSEGVNVTKLGRNGKTRATSIFLNESSSHPIGIAWASKAKKPAEARMVLNACRCVVGAEDGLFVHRKFASKYDSNSAMCVSLIAPARSLDFIFNSEEDVESFVALMKALNVRVHNRVPGNP